MWPFKKKIIDLTKNVKVPKPSFESEEYKDLTSSQTNSQESALGFLGSLASSSSQLSSDLGLGSKHIQHLKVKIEDIEYKLENLRKKIDSAIDRIDLAEKRIDRVDRR